MKSAPSHTFAIFAAIAAGALPGLAAHAATTQVVYSFAGGADGEYADTDLVMDGAGNIYGTTVQGGQNASGTVWELSPSGGSWTHSVLYNFTGSTDGGEPYKGVTLDAQGNIYGTAVTGGSGSCEGGCGVAYKLTNSGGTWTQTVIHAFTGGDDGAGPGAGLTLDDKGNVYGMTPTGGADGLGTIFRLHPKQSGNWKLTVIHAFTGGADGTGGSAGRLVFRGRHLYGAATSGGLDGYGTAYQLTPTTSGEWGFKTIYTFPGQPNAGFPYGGLIFDASGNLYGTTYYDGANNLGCVYELIPRHMGEWKEKLLHSFAGGNDGQGSIANLVFDAAGNLFGTTSEGGLGGDGVVFELKPRLNGSWRESVVHDFTGPPDGAYAYNGMVGDGAGNFFGSTVHGGADDEGAIYEFTP